MKSNHNRAPSSKNKALALASAFTLAASMGVATAEAHAKTSKTPLETLTSLISKLEKGSQIQVAASEVEIPGPITEAKGRPIVFKDNGHTYFAYTQEHRPYFINSKTNEFTSPQEVAANMAIVEAPANHTVAVTEAHIDKIGELVDENLMLVGYSAGGDS